MIVMTHVYFARGPAENIRKEFWLAILQQDFRGKEKTPQFKMYVIVSVFKGLDT